MNNKQEMIIEIHQILNMSQANTEDINFLMPNPFKAVKALVRKLHYNIGNLYLNCIITYVLTKWTDDPQGICRWGVRMALKELGRRKCVSS